MIKSDSAIDALMAKQEVYGLTREEYYNKRGPSEARRLTRMEQKMRRYHNVFTIYDGWVGNYQKNWRK